MKKILMFGMCILILLNGCTKTECKDYSWVTEGCICDYCIKVNFEQYEGKYLFVDDRPLGIIEDIDYAFPIDVEVKVCEGGDDWGYCEQELIKFRLTGRC